jgi:hypothetical protein
MVRLGPSALQSVDLCIALLSSVDTVSIVVSSPMLLGMTMSSAEHLCRISPAALEYGVVVLPSSELEIITMCYSIAHLKVA